MTDRLLDILNSGVQRAAIGRNRISITFGCAKTPREEPPEDVKFVTCRRVYKEGDNTYTQRCGIRHKSRKAAHRCCARIAKGWSSKFTAKADSYVEIIPAGDP